MLSFLKEPHCMSCKRGFLREHMVAMFPKKFLENEYKRHREDMFFEREKCMLPATQTRMEIDDERRMYTNQIKEIYDARHQLYNDLNRLRRRYERVLTPSLDGGIVSTTVLKQLDPKEKEQEKIIMNKIMTQSVVLDELRRKRARVHNLHLGTEQLPETEKEKERRQFIKKCPGDECNGFLSSQWKCSLCGINVCNKCLEIKNKDDHETHVCNPEDVKTAQLIASDTKPCPSCGTRISKLSGCSHTGYKK